MGTGVLFYPLAFLSAGAVCVCIHFLVYLLPCLLARLLVLFCFKFTMLGSVSHSSWCDHKKWVKLIQISLLAQPHPGSHQ
jgi:amino acid permease